MIAPVVWGVLPLGVALGLFIFRQWERQVSLIGGGFMLLLAGSLSAIPVDRAVRLGTWSLRLESVWEVFGRRFVIGELDRGVIAVIYFMAGVWFLGAFMARPGRLFVPLAMIVVVLWVGALAVEPFLYAALFLQIAVIISIPFLRPPGGTTGQGVLRYLSFQTLGMPFILFTGWILDQVNPEVVSPEDLILPATLVGFGFAFLMAVFPFHTWLPMLAEEAHPYVAAFIFFMLPFVVSLFGLGFLNEYPWLRDSPSVLAILRGVGFLMTLTGGLWAAFDFSARQRVFPPKERHLARILGYASVIGTGVALLAIGLGNFEGVNVFFALLFPRALSFCLWGLALTSLSERTGTLNFLFIQGVGRKIPATAVLLTLAQFSAAGFPLLAGFPAQMLLLDQLAGSNLLGAFGVILGGIGLLVAGVRTLAVLVMTPHSDEFARQSSPETPGWRIILVGGAILLMLLGVFPQWLSPLVARLPQAFSALGP